MSVWELKTPPKKHGFFTDGQCMPDECYDIGDYGQMDLDFILKNPKMALLEQDGRVSGIEAQVFGVEVDGNLLRDSRGNYGLYIGETTNSKHILVRLDRVPRSLIGKHVTVQGVLVESGNRIVLEEHNIFVART